MSILKRSVSLAHASAILAILDTRGEDNTTDVIHVQAVRDEKLSGFQLRHAGSHRTVIITTGNDDQPLAISLGEGNVMVNPYGEPLTSVEMTARSVFTLHLELFMHSQAASVAWMWLIEGEVTDGRIYG